MQTLNLFEMPPITEAPLRSSKRLTPKEAKRVAAARETAEEALGELTEGLRLFGFTKGQFSLLDLIRAVLEQTGPADLIVSTWSTGIRDAENVKWLRETGSLRSVLLLTDRSFAQVKEENVASVVEAFGMENIRCARTHAKFALIRNERWNIAIRSSMNLNRNPRFEQFDLEDNADLCEFMAAHVAELKDLMPEGLRPSGRQMQDGFKAALGGGMSEAYPEGSMDWLFD